MTRGEADAERRYDDIASAGLAAQIGAIVPGTSLDRE